MNAIYTNFRFIAISILLLMCSTSCGPSTPKEYSSKIIECYGNATLSEMSGKTEEAKACKEKAMSLDLEARTKFEKEPEKLAEYEKEMQNFKPD